MKCHKCGREFRKRKNCLTFKFRGVIVSGHAILDTCAVCLKKEQIAEMKKLMKGEYFNIAFGVVQVDWEKVRQLHSNCGRTGDSDYEILLGWLIRLKVLSYDTNQHYMVQYEGSQICFHLFGRSLYFNKKEDAEKFIASSESSSNFKILLMKDA